MGDSFTFTVSDLSDSVKINGTDFSTPINTSYGKTSTVTIKSMNNTAVDLIYKENGVNKTTSASIDGFVFLLILFGFVYLGFAFQTENLVEDFFIRSGYFYFHLNPAQERIVNQLHGVEVGAENRQHTERHHQRLTAVQA